MVALNTANLMIIRHLVQHGCNMAVKSKVTASNDDVVMDPFELAIERGHWDIARTFVLAGYNISKIDYLRNDRSATKCRIPLSLRHNRKMFLKFRKMANSTRSLHQSSIVCIWKRLKNNIVNKVEHLLLPKCLKQLLVSERFLKSSSFN